MGARLAPLEACPGRMRTGRLEQKQRAMGTILALVCPGPSRLKHFFFPPTICTSSLHLPAVFSSIIFNAVLKYGKTVHGK